MNLSTFADPIAGFLAEHSLGRRLPVSNLTASEPEIETISNLLRKGVVHGSCDVQWELRTAPGARFPQTALNEISDAVQEGYLSGFLSSKIALPEGLNPEWRIVIRKAS